MSPILVLPETRAWFGSLTSFETYLRESGHVARFKQENITRLLRNQTERELAERQLDVGLQRFRKIEGDPTAFTKDPLFVERCAVDLRDTLRYVEHQSWPRLHEIVQAFERVAEKTREIRLRSAFVSPSHAHRVLH